MGEKKPPLRGGFSVSLSLRLGLMHLTDSTDVAEYYLSLAFVATLFCMCIECHYVKPRAVLTGIQKA
jgi:hypothetical protein